MIITKEVRSGEETSGNPRAYTERSPRRCVRTVRLEKRLIFNIRWQDYKDIKESDASYNKVRKSRSC